MIEPTIKTDQYELYLADCLDVLPQLSGIDAVVADPPYGIGFKYNTHDDSADGYGEWLWGVIEQCESKCKPSSPIFVFQAMPNIRHFTEWFPREWRIYAACKNFVQMRPTAMQYAFDPVVCWWTGGEDKPFAAGSNSRDFFVANTSGVISNKNRPEKGHPCPRPEDQMRVLCEQWVRPSGLVLDPFMGSGTTGVAAIELGHRFVGIEIDADYFEIAHKRIKHAAAQRRMF